MRVLLFIITFFLILFPAFGNQTFSNQTFANQIPSQTSSDPIHSIVASSVTVMINGNNGYGVCGGTFISLTRVLTAAHCVLGEPLKIIGVIDAYGIEHAVIGEQVGIPQDLAVLAISGTAPSVAQFSIDVSVGEPIWVMGAPDGEPFMLFHGYISKITNMAFGNCSVKDKTGTAIEQQLLLDARIFYGDSGGGVFNTDGQLIGVVQRLSATGSDCTHDIPNPTVLWGYAAGPLAISKFLFP